MLIVGGGNAGYQIAEELSRGREVQRSIGSRQTPLPQRILDRVLFTYLQAARLMRVTVASRVGQRLQDRETLIGSSPRAARRRHGIHLHGRTERVEAREVKLADGGRVQPNAVIWATGYALDHSLVKASVFDDTGRVMHRRGVTSAPGLYFLGAAVRRAAPSRAAAAPASVYMKRWQSMQPPIRQTRTSSCSPQAKRRT